MPQYNSRGGGGGRNKTYLSVTWSQLYPHVWLSDSVYVSRSNWKRTQGSGRLIIRFWHSAQAGGFAQAVCE